MTLAGGSGPGRALRILIVDDHPLVLAAVKQAVAAPDIEVVGAVRSAEEALTVAPALRPDIMLLDVDLPGMSGVDLVRELAPRLPGTRIVMLTVSTSDEDLFRALGYGAVGYLTKDMTPDALQRAVRAAAVGDLAMPRRLAARVVSRIAGSGLGPAPGSTPGVLDALSSREREVLALLADGLTDRQIAEALTLSVRTIETHVANILRKLDVRNRSEAARIFRASR